MIHELRIYEFRPNALPDYMALAGGNALKIRGPELGVLYGFWLAKRGDADIAVHLWTYDSLNHRQTVRESLAVNARWNDEFVRHILPTLQSQEVRFLSPLGCMRPAQGAQGTYSLQTFETRPGELTEALKDAQERLAKTPELGQVYTGISPWPNSVSMLLRGDAAQLVDVPLKGSTLKERISMSPSQFPPLQ